MTLGTLRNDQMSRGLCVTANVIKFRYFFDMKIVYNLKTTGQILMQLYTIMYFGLFDLDL